MITNLIVGIIVFALIYIFLIPLLPAPFSTIALLILIAAAIIWLIRLLGIS